MTARQAPDRSRLRAWIERLTLFRAFRTIVIVVTLLVLAGGLLVRLVEPQVFTSFGLACWWAVTTVTTVGYGDIVPHSTAGRAVGSVLMLAGVSLIPLVTSVAVSILTAKNTRALHEQHEEQLARIQRRLDELGG